jgi:3',5'-cyclic-AMP phosphodiesterase
MQIIQLTDLHVRPLGMPSNRVSETNAMTERALRAAARLAPDAVIITGDLTECGLPAEYELLAEMLHRLLPMPVYVIPGNHDRREAMLAHLPGTRQTNGFIHYTVEDLPVRLVMLDTIVPDAGYGTLSDGRLEWLDHTLHQRPRVPTMIAMHHPPFISGIGHMDAINLRDAAAFTDVIARHKQVERIVCGHVHRPVVTRVAHAIASIAPAATHQVEFDLRPGAPSALVLEPPAFQLHAWSADTGIVSHTVLVESYAGPYPFLTYS